MSYNKIKTREYDRSRVLNRKENIKFRNNAERKVKSFQKTKHSMSQTNPINSCSLYIIYAGLGQPILSQSKTKINVKH